MTLTTATITLLLVMDPLGNIPVFITILNSVEENRRTFIILREGAIAFGALTIFLFFGDNILHALNITGPALSISGGIILFLLALKMIYPDRGEQHMQRESQIGEPLIVPLAIPLLAGPSAMAMVILFATQNPDHLSLLFIAVALSSIASILTLLFASYLRNFLGKKGLVAIERLMGMVLTTVAVQMFLTGIQRFYHFGQ